MDQHLDALSIVKTITQAGFIAYYAGGWVRDYLLNHPSDDIDIATNAPPEKIQALFPHTVPIGISFGIVLVVTEKHQYEVATFREDFDYIDGRRPSKIAFSTAENDAKRRDFTINGMFFDPLKEELLDYVEGRKDLEAKIIRAIGDPHQRIKEDRLRMVRAIRLSCRFQFAIEPHTEKAIRVHAKELFPAVAIERIVQELTKGLKAKNLYCMLMKLHEFELLGSIFPELNSVSLAQIKERLHPIQCYPEQEPLILFLLPLFSEFSLIQQIELCKRLKVSNTDRQFVEFLFSLKEQLHIKNKELFTWAHLYANSFANSGLKIIQAHLNEKEKARFIKEHEDRIHLLQKSIERIQNQDPVVKSAHLITAGIKPSKTMGTLLLAAEKIAINEQIEKPDLILDKLKTLPLWPRETLPPTPPQD